MGEGDLADGLSFLCREHATGRVVGRIDENGLGARGDVRLDDLGSDGEAVGRRQRYGDRNCAHQQGHRYIGDPVRLEDDDLIAGVGNAGQNGVDQEFAARTGQDLGVGVYSQSIILGQFGGDGLAQGRGAARGRVVGIASIDGSQGCAGDVVGRIEVRVAARKRDDVASCSFEGFGFVVDSDGGGGRDAAEKGGKGFHDRVALSVDRVDRRMCWRLL